MAKGKQTIIENTHTFYYDAKGEVTAQALADSLLGLQGLANNTAAILRHMAGGRIQAADIIITNVEIGSYKDSFIFRLIFGRGRSAEKKLEKLRRDYNLDTMDTKKLVGLLITGALLYGAWQFIKPNDPKIHVEITDSFNGVGKELGMTAEELIALYQGGIKNPEDLKKNIVRIVHPDEQERTGAITIDGIEETQVKNEVLRHVPVKYEKPDQEEPEKDFDKVEIVIRAADLDNTTNGWAAVIPDFGDERRLPLEVNESLDVSKIPFGKLLTADITVIYTVLRSGETRAKKYYLRKIHE